MAKSERTTREVVVNPRKAAKSVADAVVDASTGTTTNEGGALTIEAFLEAKARGEAQTGRGNAERTLLAIRVRLSRIEEMLDKPIAEATESEVIGLIDALERAGYRGPTIRDFVNAAAQMVDWGIFTHRVEGPKNPWRTRERKPHAMPQRVEKVLLSERQIQQLFDQLMTYGPRYNIFYRIMYYSGLPLRTVLGLQWRDVTKRGLTLHDEAGTVTRQLPLPKTLIREIEAYRRQQGETTYLFEGTVGKPVVPNQPGNLWRRAIQDLNWSESIKPGDLRDAAAQRIQDKYGDIAITQAFLGHTNPSSTARRVQTRQVSAVPYEDEILRSFGES